MIATLILGIVCLILNFISFFKKSYWGLRISFFLIFLFLGIRYNFGNDYETYINLFNRIYENEDLIFDQKMYIFYEPGWMILNWLFRPIGFFGLILANSLFYSYILYKLIRRYIPFKYYWLAIFFVVFNPGFVLIHSSTMRQTVAILIFLMTIKYLNEKKIVISILLILLASLFHYTALTLFIFAPFLYYNSKVTFTYGVLLFSTYLFLFLFGSRLAPYFGQLVALFSERYEFYSDKGITNSGLGFLFYSSLFLLTLHLDKIQNKKISLFFKITIVYFILMPFALIIEMTSRIGMYFLPATLILYPYIFKTLKHIISKYLFLFGIMIFTMYQFFQFFYSTTYRDYFMEYHTIFSAPKWN